LVAGTISSLQRFRLRFGGSHRLVELNAEQPIDRLEHVRVENLSTTLFVVESHVSEAEDEVIPIVAKVQQATGRFRVFLEVPARILM